MSQHHLISSVTELLQLTQQELTLMQTFSQVLAVEEAALIDNDAARLTEVTVDKNELLTKILVVEKQRNNILMSNRFTPDLEGMHSLLLSAKAANASEELGLAWKDLIDTSSRARENNRTNGILIHRQLNRNQSTLNLLQQNQQGGAIYGADGQSKNLPSTGRGIVAG